MDPESICEEYSLTWKGHVQHVKDSFTRLWKNSDFCDVTLYAEGQKIGAHKVFLTACSGYFSQLFQDFKEEKPVVILKGVQFDVLQQILRFIYSGEVSIEMEKLSAFLETAEFLNIFGLITDQCERRRTGSAVFETDHGSNTVEEATVAAPEFSGQCSDESEQEDFHHSSEHVLLTNSLGNSQEKPPVQKVSEMYRIDIVSVEEKPANVSTELLNKKYSFAKKEEWITDVETSKLGTELGGMSRAQPSLHQLAHDDQNCTFRKSRIKTEKRYSNLGAIKEVETMFNQDLVNCKSNTVAPIVSVTEEGFKCNICNKLFTKQHLLREHLASHTSDTTCLICGVTLSRRSMLKRHLKLHGKFRP